MTRFDGAGPVARYWLANCEGFEVRGGAHGVVEELLRDVEADPFATTRLVIRTRGRRRKVIPALAVSEVVPADRLLVVARPRRERTHAPRRTYGPRIDVAPVVAALGPPARAAARASRHRLELLARDARRVGLPMLVTLAGSFRILACETRATVRMLVRSVGSRLKT